MIPVYQTRFGQDGNCWAACLATLLDLPLEAVDQCACNHADWSEQTDKVLKERGLFLIEIETRVNEFGARVYPMVWPREPVIFIAMGPRRLPDGSVHTLNHCIVAKTYADENSYPVFEIVHDPLGERGTPLDHIKFMIFFGTLSLKNFQPSAEILPGLQRPELTDSLTH